MPRKVFTSFHYQNDNWRVQQVRNMGRIEGNPVATSNRWEEVVRSGEAAIKRWIDDNMFGKSCVVVLVGSQTASRRWVQYEIEKGWKDGKGVLGIHIHGLKDVFGNQSTKGKNPFDSMVVNGVRLSNASFDEKQSLHKDQRFLGQKINIGYKNGLALNSMQFELSEGKYSLANVPKWNEESIEARNDAIVDLLIQMFAFDDEL